jgi:hypothetical protein
MPDNINISVNETTENVVINPSISTDVIDFNLYATAETINISVTPELTTVNINSVVGGGLVTSVNGLIGDVVIPSSDNNFTNDLKNKLDGIQAGAEVNVNADWNSTSGDSQILNKPTIPSISGLATVTYVDTQDALKVDKIAGKGLSENDFTNTLKTKLDSVESGAEVNVNADWNSVSGDSQILNKPIIPVQFTKTSDLINDGEDGINPFITSADIIPQVNSDWNATSGVAEILNKPSIPSFDGLATVIYVDQQDALKVDKVTGSRLITSAEATILSNTSGVNTGDETSTTIKSKLGITTLSGSNTGDQDLSNLVVKNTSITGATKTKITYDSKGLVTNGTDATTADITDSLNKRYVTDANLVTIGNTSGTNTGDQNLQQVTNLGSTTTNSITAASLIKNGGVSTQFLKADGSVDNNIYLTSASLPSTLNLYATTTASDISGYTVLVRNISDLRFNTTAVDVSTGEITTTTQLVGSLITDVNIISGNPGIFNITTIGNISRTSGTGQAEFFFRVYKRTAAGVETFITESAKTLPVTNGGYVEFSAIALWNDGIFTDTDRIVLKYYADRLTVPTGSNPVYKFQFGGISPVRSTAAIPVAVLPNIYLKDLADVEDTDALNNEILYWNSTSNLWEHSSVIDLLSPASSTVNGYLSSADWVTFNAAYNDKINSATITGNDIKTLTLNQQDGGVITANFSIYDSMEIFYNVSTLQDRTIADGGIFESKKCLFNQLSNLNNI